LLPLLLLPPPAEFPLPLVEAALPPPALLVEPVDEPLGWLFPLAFPLPWLELTLDDEGDGLAFEEPLPTPSALAS